MVKTIGRLYLTLIYSYLLCIVKHFSTLRPHFPQQLVSSCFHHHQNLIGFDLVCSGRTALSSCYVP